MICMALSVWFVNSIPEARQCYEDKDQRVLPDIDLEPGAASTSSSSQNNNTIAILFIAVFVILIVVLTFLIVWLYKTGRSRVIQIWLRAAVFLVLAYVGGIYIFDFTRSHCIDMDWITLVLVVWNFSIVGLFAVFERVPRFLNQAYLIVISSLMAYIFRSLSGFAVWIILGILVAWDLFAVLSPFGPLNLLVQAARERDDDIPALVYDTNPTAPGRDPSAHVAKASPFHEKKARGSSTASASQTVLDTNKATQQPGSSSTNANIEPSPASASRVPKSSLSRDGSASTPAQQPTETQTVGMNALVGRETGDSIPPPTPSSSRRGKSNMFRGLFHRNRGKSNDPYDVGSAAPGGNNDADGTTAGPSAKKDDAADPFPVNDGGEVQIGTLGTHLKLGLGDFVFYSILVAQASKSGPMTAIASFVAILAGLCATLFLVTVMRKALPALPISITAGLITYFVTQYAVLPFAENLLPLLLFY